VKVLLVDVDGVWANLALMKASTHYKQEGAEVYLMKCKRMYRDKQLGSYNKELVVPNLKYDIALVSCLFSWNKEKALTIANMANCMITEVHIGGSGIDFSTNLPVAWETLVPDYTLYGISYGIGYTTRGCIRNCPWCIVPKKEGSLRAATPLKQFINPKSSNVMLFDNNLLAYSGHKDILIEMIARRLNVCFTQGLDIRLINDENANLLNKIHCTDMEFKNARLYFSWDTLNIEKDVTKGIQTLAKYRIPPSRLLFYVLCGFDIFSQKEYTWTYFMENDWYRYQTLVDQKCKPFIMKYNNRKDIPLLNAFARWCNFEHKAKKKSLGRLESFKTYLQHEFPMLQPF
jgi:hypothetical protein